MTKVAALRFSALLAAVLLLLAPVAAQATHQVGPGGLPQIADAVAVAQPGDLIVVQPGSYLPFDVSIGVRIVAPMGAVVSPLIGAQFPVSINVPAGQRASFVGLAWQSFNAYPPAIWPLSMQVVGHALFQDCSFICGYVDYEGTPTSCNGDVQFDRCQWSALDDCLYVAGGHVQLNDCQLTASWTSYNAGVAHAVVAGGGLLEIYSSTLRGAHGDNLISCPASAAIVIGGSARLRIVDSTATAGDPFYPSCSAGVSAIENTTSHPVLHTRSTLVGGSGSVGWPPVPVQAPPIEGLDQQTPLPGGMAASNGPAIGAPYIATVSGPLGALVGVGLSFDRTTATAVPFVSNPVHFDPATVIAYQWGALSMPLAAWPGFGTSDFQVPLLPAGALGLELWLHPVVWGPTGLAAGPTLGGLVR